MGKSWVAADGRTITDEMVERWERELETGEFFGISHRIADLLDAERFELTVSLMEADPERYAAD